MTAERKILGAVFVVAGVGFVAFMLWPQAVERFEPRLRQAWVAIEPEGSGVARVGPVELTAGTGFTLHAVLEGETRGGEAIYYTEAPALVMDGSPVPAEALRRWNRPQEVKVLWFTVEGALPFLDLATPEQMDRFTITEFLRLDWPRTWSVPGRIDPANDDALQRRLGEADLPFGTQRYHVRIELYPPGGALVPEARYKSWDASKLPQESARFPAAQVGLPGALGPASRFFGLTGIEPPPEPPPELASRLSDLTRRRLAFSPVPLLGELLDAAGADFDTLSWERVDPDAGPAWGEEVRAGDVLRAGARWVILYQDQGKPGRLDRADLCFDFAGRATVRPLSTVFTGEGELELARLGS